MLGFVQGPATDDTTIDSQEIAGTIDDLPELMATSPVHELILVPDPECHEETIRILYSLYHYKCPIKNLGRQKQSANPCGGEDHTRHSADRRHK